MRRLLTAAACCLAILLALPSAAYADCLPMDPRCPQPSSSPRPSSSPTPTPSQGQSGSGSQNASSRDTVDIEREFFDLINAERSRRGMGRLAYNAKLTEVARRHSAEMAANGRLYHNTDELRSDEFHRRMGYPRMVGENVGEGPSVDWLHEAFMDSPGHRANILETRYTSMGIGVVVRNSTIWVTQDFMQGGSARTQKVFPSVRKPRVNPPPAKVQGFKAVLPALPAKPKPAAAPAAIAKPVLPRISALKLPPIPAVIETQGSGEGRSRPLLPLAVLATLSAVAFASRRDAGAWI